MKKKLILTTYSLMLASAMWAADAPKWYQKVRQSLVSVITYDADGKMLQTGTGVVTGSNGEVTSEYELFKGAKRAIVLDATGKQHEVTTICGANSMYDMIKFNVDDAKKLAPMVLAAEGAKADEAVYMLSYSTNKNTEPQTGTVTEKTTAAERFNYYSLSFANGEKNVGCPIVNADGELVAFVQKSSASSKTGYALDAKYAAELAISAMSANDNALESISIKKALPEKANDALLYIYMKQGSLDTEGRLALLTDFIGKFPDNTDGYLQRANILIDLDRNEEADADLRKHASVNTKKDDALYNKSLAIYKKMVYRPEPEYKGWNLDYSLQLVDEAIKESNQPLYQNHKAAVLYALKRYDEAYAIYMEVTKTNMRSAEAFYSAAICKEQTGADRKEILALKDSAVACFSQPFMREAAPYIYARAQERAACEMNREAVADYNEYEHLMNARLNDNFYYNREQAEMKARMYKQAIEDIEKACAINPKEPAYEVERAALNLRVGNLDDAEKAARKAIELDDKSADAYRMLGYILHKNGNKTEGLANLNKAKELGDTQAEEIIKKLN